MTPEIIQAVKTELAHAKKKHPDAPIRPDQLNTVFPASRPSGGVERVRAIFDSYEITHNASSSSSHIAYAIEWNKKLAELKSKILSLLPPEKP